MIDSDPVDPAHLVEEFWSTLDLSAAQNADERALLAEYARPVEIFESVLSGDQDTFTSTVEAALAAHFHRYNAKRKRASYTALFPHRLLAMIKFGQERGFTVDYGNPYLKGLEYLREHG